MDLQLTREELMTLIESVHLASHIRTGDEVTRIEGLLLQCASDAGLDGLVVREAEGPVLNSLMVRALHDEMSRYEDDIFWSTLSEELAERDLRLVRSEEEIEALTDEDYDAIIEGQARRYDAEFSAHGSDHLSLAHELPIA